MSLTKRVRFVLRFVLALVKKWYLVLIISGLVGGLFFYFFPKIIEIIPPIKRTQKIGLVGQYVSNELPDEILNEISFGLLSLSEKGDPLPNIAKSWTATDGGKTYTFNLDPGEFIWHDGSSFNPADINYNFKDASFSFFENKVTFKLKEQYSPFPVVVSKPLFKKGLIGLGEYKIKKIVRNGKKITSVFLSPSENKNLANKVYRFYNNESDLKLGLNLGEINEIPNLFDTENIAKSPSIKIKENIMYDAYLAVFFNTNNPIFADKSFRQALSYAIPKEDLPLRCLGPLNPKSWAYNPDVKPYNLDLKRSKSLLEKNKIDSVLKIKISTLPQHEAVANMIKENWEKVGIESEVNLSPFIPDDFEVLIVARKIPDDPDQYYFWHSTQAGNLSKFKSPRIDKLLEDGRKTIDKEERKTIYFDFQRFLVEESPAVFLFHPISYEVTRK